MAQAVQELENRGGAPISKAGSFDEEGAVLPNLTRRGFIAASLAAGSLRIIPTLATRSGGRRILTLVYDKSLGMMRAVERVVP